MGRKKIVQNLSVFLGSKKVGVLTKQTNGAIHFKYTENWIQEGFPISLSLPLADRVFSGDKVSFYFDNLLPDNNLLLEAIAKKVHAESIQPFDLLNAIGRECVGALSFHQENEIPKTEPKMSVRLLKESDIAERIRNLATDNPLGMDEGDFRILIAGVQEKMALLSRKNKWYEPQGRSATSHILKKKMGTLAGNINFDKSVDNEWICLFLAKHFEIEACHADIISFEDQRVLSVERFDRLWKDNFLYRRPQEDFCQALGVSPQGKYERSGGPSIEKMMSLLQSSNNAEKDRKMFFKTAIFNDLIYNTDAHAKNFSLFITPIGFAMTPMYDLLSAHFLEKLKPDRYRTLRSSLSVNSKFIYKDITLADWRIEAKKCLLSGEVFEEMMEELRSSVDAIGNLRNKIPGEVDHAEFATITEGLRKRMRSFEPDL